jgi:hypothetical protein
MPYQFCRLADRKRDRQQERERERERVCVTQEMIKNVNYAQNPIHTDQTY